MDIQWSALLGGALIGLAAVWLMWATGRIAGISGIWFGAVFGPAAERLWRLIFLAGLVISGWIYAVLTPAEAPTELAASLPKMLIAGFLVGLGTRLSNGCTSGHGVCGLARLSPRSLAAVLTFLCTAIATVWFARAVG